MHFRALCTIVQNAQGACPPVHEVVDETWLNYYIIKMGLFQLNTHFYKDTFLTDLFDIEDLYNLWKTDNVWWYLNHGSSELNGGDRPFTQRYLLRQIIADADSCLQLVFYRSDIHDQDVLFKVLLNEQEVQLPMTTDYAPYYHWKDFRAFYLDKLDKYDERRKKLSDK